MRILFVCPGFENLGIECLSAVLKQEGHNVELAFDPRLFKTYWLESDFLAKCFDFSKIILNKVKCFKPELICFSVFSDHYNWARDIAKKIKYISYAPVIFGGIHPSSVPERVIEEPYIDYVCVGEGEGAIVDLCKNLESGEDPSNIPNIWLKKEGKVVFNEIRPLISDLDILPFPDKDLFKLEYKDFVKNYYITASGRGCPYSCTFCYNSYMNKLYSLKGQYLRRRSVGNVIAELKIAKEKYGIKQITFADDTFNYDYKWLESFSNVYKDQIRLPYFCFVHPNFINENTVSLLKNSGCVCVSMGLETANVHIKKKILHRKESNEVIQMAIRLLRDKGIFIYTNMLFGLPLQDESVLADDIRFSSRYKADMPASNLLRYYPKTEIIYISNKLGLLNEGDIEKIETGKDFQPYFNKTNKSIPNIIKMKNLLSISHLLPPKITEQILTKKLYKFLPIFDLRFFILSFSGLYKKFFKQKTYPFPSITVSGILKIYFVYIVRWGKNIFIKN